MATTDPCAEAKDFSKWNQAGAQAYYACRYFAATQDTNFWRNAIALIQQATQFYFADKQYEIASRAQDRLDNVSNIELNRSGKLFGQFEKQISQEDAQLARAVERLNIPEPDYNAIRLRVTASVIRQFTEPKRKIEQCYPVSCMEARCNALGKIATEEAKTIASEVEQAYQKERSLYEIRLATARAELAEVLKFGRGALNAANAALEGASRAAIQAGSINPYSGYIQAVNSTAQTLQGMTTQEALSYRGMGINVGNSIGLANQANSTPTTLSGPQMGAMTLDAIGQGMPNQTDYNLTFSGMSNFGDGSTETGTGTGLKSGGDIFSSIGEGLGK